LIKVTDLPLKVKFSKSMLFRGIAAKGAAIGRGKALGTTAISTSAGTAQYFAH
jgi:hypothetical protein